MSEEENKQKKNKKHRILNITFGVILGLLLAGVGTTSGLAISNQNKLSKAFNSINSLETENKEYSESVKTLEQANETLKNANETLNDAKAALEAANATLQEEKEQAEENYNAAISKKNITITKTYVNVIGTAPKTVSNKESATVRFMPISGYELPNSVTVTGSKFAWDKVTGTLYLFNPTSDVQATIIGVKTKTAKIMWGKANILDGKSLYETAATAERVYIGKTSDYASYVNGLTPIHVGETEDDVVYAYIYNKTFSIHWLYVLSDKEITFELNDFIEPYECDHYFDTYADIDFSILTDETYFCVRNDENNDNEKTYYFYQMEGLFFAVATGDIQPFSYLNDTKVLVLQNLDTSSMSDFSYFFSNNNNLQYLDISGVDFVNATNYFSLFCGDSCVTYIDTFYLKTENVTNMSSMFDGCQKLTTLDVSNFNTSKVTDMSYMFEDCESLDELDLSSFDTSNVTNMSYMFTRTNMDSIDLSSFNTSNVTNMSFMFEEAGLYSLDVSMFNTSKVLDMNSMFSNMENLTSINLESFDFSNCENLAYMFYSSEKLETISFASTINSSKVEYFNGFVAECTELTNIVNISELDTDSALEMQMMFQSTGLVSLDLHKFNTENVTNMDSMFAMNYNLTSLNVTGFDTSSVETMKAMFYAIRKIKGITGLSSFDTSNVTNMEYMFRYSEKLESLDLRSFDTSNVDTFNLMFDGCLALKTIYASSNFTIKEGANTDGMFSFCESLAGGKNTKASETGYDSLYAAVDTGVKDGYFTNNSPLSGENQQSYCEVTITCTTSGKTYEFFPGIVPVMLDCPDTFVGGTSFTINAGSNVSIVVTKAKVGEDPIKIVDLGNDSEASFTTEDGYYYHIKIGPNAL